MDVKFYKCERCGNIIEMVENHGGALYCCGAPMNEMTVNTVDASFEKHVPTYVVEDNKVKVFIGSVHHPMVPEHHIVWVEIKTKMGIQRKYIANKEEPKVCFVLCKHDELLEVYAYCNLHGLWKA